MARLCTLSVLGCLLLACHSSAAERPNIVLIMADDMGYSDVGCYGGEIRTPNIDRLARGGMRFSLFYNNALCGPTRASLMTGLYCQQVGVQGWTGVLNDRCATIPELLKQAGYSTLVVGRLDMTTSGDWYDPEQAARHLDRFFGTGGKPGTYGPGHYSKPVRTQKFFCNGQEHRFPPDATFYKTDLYTDYGRAAEPLTTCMPHADKVGWRMGFSAYSFRNVTAFEALDKMAATGLHYTELFAWQKLSPAHPDATPTAGLSRTLQKDLKKKAADSGVQLLGLYSNIDKPEAAKALFAFAAEMESEFIVSEPTEALLDTIEPLTEQYGIDLALHNQPTRQSR